MRKLLILLMLLCLTALPAPAEELSVIIATDLHYLSPALTDNGPFFTDLVNSADGKVMLQIDPLCEAFTEQVIAREPDCLILSGDLTFNGEKRSHLDLAAKLARIEAAGIPVLVIPGNHDLNAAAHAFHGAGCTSTESITPEEFRRIYAAFGYDDAISCDPTSLSFIWQLAPGWRVLMLDVNTPLYPGRAAPGTLVWAEAQLIRARKAGDHVIAVSHQNLLPHSALFTSGYVIANADELRTLYADADVVCHFSGHMHMQHIAAADMPEVVTSALSVAPCQYGLITLGDALSYRTEAVDVSAWAARHGRTAPELTSFAAHAEGFFLATARAQALAQLANDPEAEALAAWFAQLNACYFSGRMDLADRSGAHAQRWRERNVFFSLYIASILQETPADHTRFVLPVD